MAKIILNHEQKLLLGTTERILGLFEIMLDEENMEMVLEGEDIFFQTKDNKNAFKLVDKSMNRDDPRNGVILLPRTTDAQEFIPIRLDGKDLF